MSIEHEEIMERLIEEGGMRLFDRLDRIASALEDISESLDKISSDCLTITGSISACID